MTAQHNHPPACCCPVLEVSENGRHPVPGQACPGCPEHGTFAQAEGIRCPQCTTPIGRPHTDYCTLAPGRVWDGVLPQQRRASDVLIPPGIEHLR